MNEKTAGRPRIIYIGTCRDAAQRGYWWLAVCGLPDLERDELLAEGTALSLHEAQVAAVEAAEAAGGISVMLSTTVASDVLKIRALRRPWKTMFMEASERGAFVAQGAA